MPQEFKNVLLTIINVISSHLTILRFKIECEPTPAWKKQKKKGDFPKDSKDPKETKKLETMKKEEWGEESPSCLKKTETMLITTNRNR